MCKKGCSLACIAKILVLIGGLNWGLIGIGGFVGSDWNIVNLLLGGVPALEWIIYVLVGLGALKLCFSKSCCSDRKCSGGSCGTDAGSTGGSTQM